MTIARRGKNNNRRKEFFFKYEREREKTTEKNMEAISTRKKCRRLHLWEEGVVYACPRACVLCRQFFNKAFHR